MRQKTDSYEFSTFLPAAITSPVDDAQRMKGTPPYATLNRDINFQSLRCGKMWEKLPLLRPICPKVPSILKRIVSFSFHTTFLLSQVG